MGRTESTTEWYLLLNQRFIVCLAAAYARDRCETFHLQIFAGATGARGRIMSKKLFIVAVAASAFAGVVAIAQYPIMDKVASKVIQKYQTSTCEQLYQEKAQSQGKPKSAEEQRAVEILRGDPKMQAAFFGKISTPVVSKMFECGMIP